jgi:mannose-1-phosphate guanylyltransferase
MKRSPMKDAAAVILAGGKSSRLFPFNKVLSDLTGSGRTLIQQTQDRLTSFSKNAIYALTTSEMVAPVQRQLQLATSHILVDPVRRGTWPAILWAMAHLRRTNPNTLLGILPGDHAIQNNGAFKDALSQAVELARDKPAVVMIGISPNATPEEWRGLGCFHADDQGRITQFQEKPGDTEVQRMIDEGDWYWNSGMFFFRISTAERALETYQPEMHSTYTALATALAKGKIAEAASHFRNFPDKISHPLEPGRRVDNSIDYAVMTSLVSRPVSGLEARAVRDVGFRWTDLGQWSALKHVVNVDSRGNIRIGDIKVGPDVRDSILVADRGHRIEVSEADAMIIAFSGKQALVVPVSQVARVKEMVAAAKDGRAIVGEMPYIASFATSKRSNVAILSNWPKEAL